MSELLTIDQIKPNMISNINVNISQNSDSLINCTIDDHYFNIYFSDTCVKFSNNQLKALLSRRAYVIDKIINPIYQLSDNICVFTGHLPDNSIINIKYFFDYKYEKYLSGVLVSKGKY